MAILHESWYEIDRGGIQPLDSDQVPPALRTRSLNRFKNEGQLTYMLYNYPDLIEEGLMIVRADPEGKGGADLTGITKDGQIVVVESKKGTVNTSTLGQAFGYALEAEKWPKDGYLLSKQKYWDVKDTDALITRIDTGTNKELFPKIFVVGNNVTASILEMADYIAGNRINGKKVDVSIVSVGFYSSSENASVGHVCRRQHQSEIFPPVGYRDFKPGDIVQRLEGIETDGYEVPYYVIGYADDGQVRVKKTRKSKKETHVPYGDEISIPFLANYKKLAN